MYTHYEARFCKHCNKIQWTINKRLRYRCATCKRVCSGKMGKKHVVEQEEQPLQRADAG